MMVMGGAERWATGLEFFANSVTFEVLDLSTRDDWVKNGLPLFYFVGKEKQKRGGTFLCRK